MCASAQLSRARVNEIVREGFFPRISLKEAPTFTQRHRGVRVALCRRPRHYPPSGKLWLGTARVAAALERHSRDHAGTDRCCSTVASRSEALLDLLETLSERSTCTPASQSAPGTGGGAGCSGLCAELAGKTPRWRRLRTQFLVLDDETAQHRGVCLLPQGHPRGTGVAPCRSQFSYWLASRWRLHLAPSRPGNQAS